MIGIAVSSIDCLLLNDEPVDIVVVTSNDVVGLEVVVVATSDVVVASDDVTGSEVVANDTIGDDDVATVVAVVDVVVVSVDG
jgi:hypothetical protein